MSAPPPMTGRWRVTAQSPLGDLTFDVDLTDRDGTLAATATYGGQRVDVEGVQVVAEGAGHRARWTQRLTAPVRVTVHVDALVVGDRLTGTAKAGFFPRAALRGSRVD